MKSTWKRFRHRLEYLGVQLLAAGVPLLPRRICLLVAHALGDLYYRCDARNRRIALENLRVCFGETMSATERERVARASFRNFGRAMLDLFWAKRLTHQNFSRYLKLEGFEEARALHVKYGGTIMVVLHQGSYEWLGLGIAYGGLPLWIVALDFKNPALDAVFAKARGHSGNLIINQHQSMLKLLRAVRRNGGAGLLLDLTLGLEHPGEIIEAFGMKMHVTFLHALLHQRTGVPIIPLTDVPHPDGTCTITAHPPLTFPPDATRHQIVQAYWDFFEPFIRERPDLWLWSYRHWRHKPRDSTREYPAYARYSAKFEEVLAREPEDSRRPGRRADDPLAASEAVEGLGSTK